MRYLQATGEFSIGTKLCVVSLLLHTLALVILFLFGIASLTTIAIVASLTMFGNFIVLMFFWNKLNREQNILMLPIYEGAFSDLTIYLKLGIPSAILTMSEFVIFEIMTLMAAYIGAVELATISVVVNILSIGYETTGGLSTALTSLIGRLLGEEKPSQAKKVAVVGFSFHFLLMTFFASILLSIPRFVCGMFTLQPDILS